MKALHATDRLLPRTGNQMCDPLKPLKRMTLHQVLVQKAFGRKTVQRRSVPVRFSMEINIRSRNLSRRTTS